MNCFTSSDRALGCPQFIVVRFDCLSDCQAFGFEIPCMLYKLVSFILHCTHVELPPLDFNIQIYVKIMQMLLL